MSELELRKAIREAIQPTRTHGEAIDAIAAAITPLIEAQVREARADALTEVADVLDASTAKFDRAVGGPTMPTTFVRHIAQNLRNDRREDIP